VIEDPELPSLLLAKGDCRPDDLSDFYPISIQFLAAQVAESSS
jgi:hypothetical protein